MPAMRVSLHIVEARRERLRALIRHDGFLPLGEICRRLDISEATARRDLAAIEADGQITRTYGGALADYNMSFASINERERRARSAKARIAKLAAQNAPETGTLFLDAGTTALAVARALARGRSRQLTVVTNGLAIASVLGGAAGITLHLLGGIFLNRQSMLFGDHAVGALDRWHFDAAFLGGEAMNSDGVFNSHPETVRLHHAVLTRTENVFFCIDATKLGKATPHHVTVWGQNYRLVTDADSAQLRAAGIALKKTQLFQA